MDDMDDIIGVGVKTEGMDAAQESLKKLIATVESLERNIAIIAKSSATSTQQLVSEMAKIQAEGGNKLQGIMQSMRERAIQSLSSSENMQIGIVREGNQRLQTLYETRLATAMRLSNEELAMWKSFGANLGNVQKAQMKGLNLNDLIPLPNRAELTARLSEIKAIVAEADTAMRGLFEKYASTTAIGRPAIKSDIANLEGVKTQLAKEAAETRAILEDANFILAEIAAKAGAKNAATLAAIGAANGKKEANALFDARSAAFVAEAAREAANTAASGAVLAQMKEMYSKDAVMTRVMERNAAAGAMIGRSEAVALFSARSAAFKEAAAVEAAKAAHSPFILAEMGAMYAKDDAILKAGIRARIAALRAEKSAFNLPAEESSESVLARMRDYYSKQAAPAGSGFAGTQPLNLTPAAAGVKELSNAMQAGTGHAHGLSGALGKLHITGNDVHSMMRGLASGFNLLWLTWGNLLPLMAGAAVSMGAMASMRIGTEVAADLSVIQHIAGATGEEMIGLSAKISEIGKTTQFGPRETAAALKTLALAGLDAAESAAALRSVLNFSIVGEMKADKAAESLIAIGTAFGYAAKDIGVVGDYIAKAAAISMADTAGMTESFRAASVVAQQYGVSLNDAAMNLVFLNQVGVKGSAAGTAMKNMYTELMSGSKKASAALKEMGIETMTAEGAARPLIQVIGELDVALSRKNAKAQASLLADMANNRGAKDLVAVLQAYRTAVNAANPAMEAQAAALEAVGNAAEATAVRLKMAQTNYAKMQEELDNSAGFTSIASAERSLAPDQQFKGVKAALDTALNDSFKNVADSLYILGDAMKTVFNDPAFVGALTSINEGAITLVGGLVALVAAVEKYHTEIMIAVAAMASFVIGFEGFVVVPAVIGAVGTAITVVRNAIAAFSLTVALAGGGLGGLLTGLATVAAQVLSGPVGWGILAASIGTYIAVTWDAKNATDALSDAEIKAATAGRLRSADFMTSIQARIDEFKLKDDAKNNLTTIEMERLKKEASADKTRTMNNHQAEIDLAMRNLDKATASGNAKEIADATAVYEKKKVLRNVELAERALKIDELMALERQKKKEADEAATKNRNRPVGTEGRDPKPVKESKTLKEQWAQEDKENQRRWKEITDAESAATKAAKETMSNELAMLESQHKNKLISEGEYQTKMFETIQKGEAASTQARSEAIKRAGEQMQAREAEINARKIAPEDSKDAKKVANFEAQQENERLENLRRFNAALDGLQQEQINMIDAANLRMVKASNDAAGAVKKMNAEVDKFLEEDAASLEAARKSVGDGFDSGAPGAKEGIETTRKYNAELAKLAIAYREAASAYEAWKAASEKEGATDATKTKLAEAEKLKEQAQAAIDRIKDRMPGAVAESIETGIDKADTEKLRKFIDGMATSITVLFEDPTKAMTDIRKLIVDYFIREPITVFIKAVMKNGLASVTSWLGMGGSGGGSGGEGGGSGSSFLSGASSFLNVITGGASSAFSAGASYGFQSLAANGFGATMSAGSQMIGAGSYASGIGTMTGAVAPYAMAYMAIRALTDYKITPSGSGIVANLGANAPVGTFQQYNQSSSGILSGGNTVNRDWGVADEGTTRYINDSVKAITAGNRAYAEALGLDTTALEAFTSMVEINTDGMDAAAAKVAIDTALDKFAADQAQAAFGDVILEFALTGESASDTLARLATDLTVVNATAKLFGATLLDVSAKGAAAAEKLITAFGGVDKFQAAMGKFYDTYYTEAEKDSNTVKNVQGNLHKAGIDISEDELKNATVETTRAWIDAAYALWEAGVFTEAQLAAAITGANDIAAIATKNTEKMKTAKEKYEDNYSTEAEKKSKVITDTQANLKANGIDIPIAALEGATSNVVRAWIDTANALYAAGVFTAAQLQAALDGANAIAPTAKANDGPPAPADSGGGGGGGGGSSVGIKAGDPADFENIKKWLDNMNVKAEGGVSIFEARDNALAEYSKALASIKAGDKAALADITDKADSYIESLKLTSSSALEEALGIARIKGDMSALLPPEQQIINQLITIDNTLKHGFGAILGTDVGGGDSGMSMGSGKNNYSGSGSSGGGLGSGGAPRETAPASNTLMEQHITALSDETAKARADARIAQAAMIALLARVAKMQEKWDGDGMPDIRSNT